jgi:hypothetical protein
LGRRRSPLFRAGERGVDEGFGEVDSAAAPEIFREPLQQEFKPAGSLPQLEATMAGLIGRIATREIVPRRTSA